MKNAVKTTKLIHQHLQWQEWYIDSADWSERTIGSFLSEEYLGYAKRRSTTCRNMLYELNAILCQRHFQLDGFRDLEAILVRYHELFALCELDSEQPKWNADFKANSFCFSLNCMMSGILIADDGIVESVARWIDPNVAPDDCFEIYDVDCRAIMPLVASLILPQREPVGGTHCDTAHSGAATKD